MNVEIAIIFGTVVIVPIISIIIIFSLLGPREEKRWRQTPEEVKQDHRRIKEEHPEDFE